MKCLSWLNQHILLKLRLLRFVCLFVALLVITAYLLIWLNVAKTVYFRNHCWPGLPQNSPFFPRILLSFGSLRDVWHPSYVIDLRCVFLILLQTAFSNLISSPNPLGKYIPPSLPPCFSSLGITLDTSRCSECGDAFLLRPSLRHHYERRSILVKVRFVLLSDICLCLT